MREERERERLRRTELPDFKRGEKSLGKIKNVNSLENISRIDQAVEKSPLRNFPWQIFGISLIHL